MDDLYFVVRSANIVIGTVALVWIMVRLHRRRHTIPFELRLLIYVIGFLVLGGVEVSIEAIIYDQEKGIRSFIFLFGNIWAIVALALTHTHRHLEIKAR